MIAEYFQVSGIILNFSETFNLPDIAIQFWFSASDSRDTNTLYTWKYMKRSRSITYQSAWIPSDISSVVLNNAFW